MTLDRAGLILFGSSYVGAMAEALGVHRVTVRRWRDGQSPVPAWAWARIEEESQEREKQVAEVRRTAALLKHLT